MSHPIDASVKHLVTEWLPDWLPLSGRPATGPVETIDADLSTITAYADKVLRVGGVPPWLLHLELQSYRDPEMAARLHYYNALLEYRHGAPVWSVVVLLSRATDHGSLTGLYQRGFADEAPYRSFRYQVVRVWRTPAETLLTGGLGTLPLAPLSDVREEHLPEIIRRMDERINAEAAPDQRGGLWTAAGVLMGLRYEDGLIDHLLRGVRSMENSTYYQHILAKGRVEGREEGREEGELREARKLLLRLGRKRLGSPPAETEAALNAIADLDRLESLSERLLLVSSWDELLAAA